MDRLGSILFSVMVDDLLRSWDHRVKFFYDLSYCPLVFFIMTAVCGRPFFSLGLRSFSDSVGSFKFLGIYISSDLSWAKHCDVLVKKAKRRLYAIRKLKGARVKENDLVAVYCSLIRSILEYNPLYSIIKYNCSVRLDNPFNL